MATLLLRRASCSSSRQNSKFEWIRKKRILIFTFLTVFNSYGNSENIVLQRIFPWTFWSLGKKFTISWNPWIEHSWSAIYLHV